jgi:16S rRNA (cytidine1402-2'-O)-methyltransferase
MSTLYIVATPIGNLGDLTGRATDILKSVFLILCEDTRNTRVLLDHYEIKKPLLSYHQHSKLDKVQEIISLLNKGKDLALVSDAGTPGISDPGSQLVKEVLQKVENVKIVPVPGANAAISALCISGFSTAKFLFLGFPPIKNKRKRFFEEAVAAECPVVFYESTYRIIKTLKELAALNDQLEIVVCRELTKKFETVYRGQIQKVIKILETGETRGEFVVVIGKEGQ